MLYTRSYDIVFIIVSHIILEPHMPTGILLGCVDRLGPDPRRPWRLPPSTARRPKRVADSQAAAFRWMLGGLR